MVIVVVVKVRLVEVGGRVVVVKLVEGSGVMVVVVQVVMVENGAASAMLSSRPRKTAKKPRIEARRFMVGKSCTGAEIGFNERVRGWRMCREAADYQVERVWMEEELDIV